MILRMGRRFFGLRGRLLRKRSGHGFRDSLRPTGNRPAKRKKNTSFVVISRHALWKKLGTLGNHLAGLSPPVRREQAPGARY